MNYIGSKHKLSSWLLSSISDVCGPDLSKFVFCDLFAGTGSVGRTFKPLVKGVIANDLEFYSYVLNQNYIGNNEPIDASAYIEELENLPPKAGFIFNTYCEDGASGRLYFSAENGKKIDTIRSQIEVWFSQGEINEDVYFFLLASLLESADKVANTASVYGAYLKKLKKSAQNTLTLKPADFEITPGNHSVYNQNSNELIKAISGDILYLDPPYNARQYGANYHVLNTIAKKDTFVPKGKTGLRSYKKSAFCSKIEVATAFEELIKQADFKTIFLSYNNEGLMPAETVKAIMQRYGKYDLVTTSYQRFKADKTENRNHKATGTTEYLHILEK
ncbi:DNA adenine methylase [Leeuwenhoekiella nanhaiensis]|uniref:site-specific DNA-methyltransferase (adenine-specific) n=1 Tax=Leeuwenhoekiella nanhaiensis TaxID=1655491 RepID=A0A2G1VVF8_9FLAO|nr:DNA adenine methylase [Leeuwenhoekiella nanhaiensis]PHQ30767.1 modification methylase [Leeuwenhoekiella nanhaiensis]